MSTAAISPTVTPLVPSSSLPQAAGAVKGRTVVAQANTATDDKAAAKPADATAVVPVVAGGAEKEQCDDKAAKTQGAKDDDGCAAAVVPQDSSPLWLLAALPLLGAGGGGEPHRFYSVTSELLASSNGEEKKSSLDDLHFDLNPGDYLNIYQHSGGELHIGLQADPDQCIEFKGDDVQRVLFEKDAGYLSSFGFHRDGQHFNFWVQEGRDGNDLVIGNEDSSDPIIGGKGHDILFATDKGDTLIGGKGQDLMFAGFGEDTFEFSLDDLVGLQDGQPDIIIGFDKAWDKIDLGNISLADVTANVELVGDSEVVVLSYKGSEFLEVHIDGLLTSPWQSLLAV